MSKQIKRVLALVLAIVLVLSMSACASTPTTSSGSAGTSSTTPPASSAGSADASSKEEDLYYNKEGLPICDETITIKVAGINEGNNVWNDTLVVREMEKQLGIKWDCTEYLKDAWANQFALMLANNNLPDLTVAAQSDKALINGYGDDGYLLDMNEYKELMPNMWAMFEEFPDYATYSQTAEGKLYSLGSARADRINNNMGYGWIPKSWLENVDMDAPKTIEELTEVLRAFKEKDANGNGDTTDEIPMSFTIGRECAQRVDWTLKVAFGIVSINAQYMLYDNGDGKASIYDITDEYRAYLTWLNELYEENLLDHEIFTQTDAELRDKVKTNRVGFAGDWSGLNTALGANDLTCWADYEFYNYFTSDVHNAKKTVTMYPSYSGGCRYWISAETKYPEALCRMTDWFYSEEGRMLIAYGVEGETYALVEDSFGNKFPTTDGFWEDKYESKAEWNKTNFITNFLWTSGIPAKNLLIIDADDKTLQKYIDEGGKNGYTYSALNEKALREADELITSFPFLVYTAEEVEQRTSLHTDILAELKAYQADFITGAIELTDENWNTYVQKIKSMGLDEVLAIDTASYQRYVAAAG